MSPTSEKQTETITVTSRQSVFMIKEAASLSSPQNADEIVLDSCQGPSTEPQEAYEKNGGISIPPVPVASVPPLVSDEMDPLLKQRKLLLTDSDLFIAVDYSNTLAEDWIGGALSIWLTKYYFRRMGGIFLAILVVTLCCIFANLIQPNNISKYLMYSTYGLGFTYPLFIIFVLQSTIARMTLRHFESMFLLFNAVVSILCLGDIVGWSVTMCIGSVLYIMSYFCIIFMDSWPMSFSVYDYLFSELNSNVDADSFRAFQEQSDRRGSLLQQLAGGSRPHFLNQRQSSITSLMQGRRPSRRDSRRTSSLPLEMVASPKNTIRKCKEFYAKLTYFHQGIFKITTFLKPFQYMVTLVGFKQLLILLFGIFVPIISQLLLPVDSADLDDITTFRVLKSLISTKSIFRACVVNVMMFCFRRVVMSFLFPLKLYGMSRKITRIVLVEGWHYFISDEFYHRRRRLLQSNNNSSISYIEPTVKIQQNRRLSKRTSNAHKFEIFIQDTRNSVRVTPQRRELGENQGSEPAAMGSDLDSFSPISFSPRASFMANNTNLVLQEGEGNLCQIAENSEVDTVPPLLIKPIELEVEKEPGFGQKLDDSDAHNPMESRRASQQNFSFMKQKELIEEVVASGSGSTLTFNAAPKAPPGDESCASTKIVPLNSLRKQKGPMKEDDAESSLSSATSLSSSARIGVIFTPGKLNYVYDLNNSIWKSFLSEKYSSRVLHLCKLVNKIEAWCVLPLWVFICLELTTEFHEMDAIPTFIYAIGLFFSLVHVSMFNRSGIYKVLVSFETAFALVNSLMVHAFFMDLVCHHGRGYRSLMILSSFLITFRVICIDAQPVSFTNFHKNLEGLHHQIENGEDFDMDVFVVVMKLSHLIRSKIDRHTDRRQGWIKSENEAKDLFEESNTTDTFWKRTKRRWALVRFFSNGAMTQLFMNIFHVLCVWILVDGDLILSPFDREYHSIAGPVNTKGLIRAALFNLGVIYVRRLWSHFCDPTRSICIERRVVKIPLVPSLFPEQQAQPLQLEV